MNYGLPSSLVADNPTDPITGNPDTYIPNGDYSAQIGQFGYSCNPPGVPLGYASVEQQLWIPDVPGQDVEIKFKYIIYSEDRAIGPPLDPNDYDRLEVYVMSTSGSELVFSDANKGTNFGCSVWSRVPGPNNIRNGKTTGWAEATIDMSDYEGESILLSFRNYNRTDGFYNTVSFIDDVELNFIP